MSIYRNRGAQWRRADGTLIERGAEFVPTEEERLRKAHKLEYVRPNNEASSAAPVRADVEDYAQGGGWYLIEGEKVQGRAAATELLNALHPE